MIDSVGLKRPVYLPRGVADPQSRTGYIANAAGGIDALSLSAGELVWRTDAASRPLIVYGDRLIALRLTDRRKNLFQITALNLNAEGSPALKSEPLTLPDWVNIEGGDNDFALKVYVARGTLVLDWEAHLRYGGGAPPSARVLAQHTKDAVGGVRVDLQSGAVGALDFREGGGAYESEDSSRGWGELSPVEAWTVEGRDVALLCQVSDSEVAFYLKSREGSGGRAAGEVKLLAGQSLVPHVTPDGLYVFFHQEGYEAGARGESTWHVFSVETAERVAELTHEEGAAQPCVVGPNVYYLLDRLSGAVLNRALRAKEMATDRVLWERPLQQLTVSRPRALRQ